MEINEQIVITIKLDCELTQLEFDLEPRVETSDQKLPNNAEIIRLKWLLVKMVSKRVFHRSFLDIITEVDNQLRMERVVQNTTNRLLDRELVNSRSHLISTISTTTWSFS